MARLTENLNLQRGLLQHLDKFPDVELRQRTKVASISPDQSGWPLVTLDDGTMIRARLLVSFSVPAEPWFNCCRLGQMVPIRQSGIMLVFSRMVGRTTPRALLQQWFTLLAVPSKGQTRRHISDSSQLAPSPSCRSHPQSHPSFGLRNHRLRKPCRLLSLMYLWL